MCRMTSCNLVIKSLLSLSFAGSWFSQAFLIPPTCGVSIFDGATQFATTALLAKSQQKSGPGVSPTGSSSESSGYDQKRLPDLVYSIISEEYGEDYLKRFQADHAKESMEEIRRLEFVASSVSKVYAEAWNMNEDSRPDSVSSFISEMYVRAWIWGDDRAWNMTTMRGETEFVIELEDPNAGKVSPRKFLRICLDEGISTGSSEYDRRLKLVCSPLEGEEIVLRIEATADLTDYKLFVYSIRGMYNAMYFEGPMDASKRLVSNTLGSFASFDASIVSAEEDRPAWVKGETIATIRSKKRRPLVAGIMDEWTRTKKKTVEEVDAGSKP
eukprot:scaffold1736_cov127-Cylindrotheca_fusiformis.AAC.11